MSADETSVREIMSATPRTIAPTATVAEAADVLAEINVSSLPVVDADGALVGMLRDDDLVASESRVHVPTFINFLGLAMPFPGEMRHLEHDIEKISGKTVSDVMDEDPPTIGADGTLEDAATLMHDRHVNTVPVIDAQRHVVGIVARHDIVRFIARTT